MHGVCREDRMRDDKSEGFESFCAEFFHTFFDGVAGVENVVSNDCGCAALHAKEFMSVYLSGFWVAVFFEPTDRRILVEKITEPIGALTAAMVRCDDGE